MATKKPTTEFAQGGVASKPVNEIAEIISQTSEWQKPACKDDEEVLARISEYQNLCALRGHAPYIEDLCLYLGISKDRMHNWKTGEGCSKIVKEAIELALTWILSIDNKLTDQGKKPYVMRIWNGKQWHDEREPNSKLEDLLQASLLKDLPSQQSIAQRYLEDFDESEVDDDSTGTD